MKKIVITFIFAFYALIATGHSTDENIKWTCVLYRADARVEVAKGIISTNEFKIQFTEDYLDTGAREEVPDDAAIVGELSLQTGSIPISMIIYRWSQGGREHWLCQSKTMGKAPRFFAKGSSEQTFLDDLRTTLQSLDMAKKAEQAVAPNRSQPSTQKTKSSVRGSED